MTFYFYIPKIMRNLFVLAFLLAVQALSWSTNLYAQTTAPETQQGGQAQRKTPVQCDAVWQMLFLVDVSGSMATNDRLAEAKQFALRIVQEHAAENLLYKLISYGGSCNEIITDVNWTRDATVINAGIKGLYLRGGTPLGSALEFTIDEIKKSAYPDQTRVILLNDGANGCGEVSEILARRVKEIPCVRFVSIGIELEEEENGFSSRAIADAQAIAAQTGGFYVPLGDVREIRGVSVGDTSIAVRPVEFEPRKKPQVQAKAEEKPAEQAPQAQTQTQAQPQTQTQSPSQEKPQEKPQEKAPEKSQEKAPAQTEAAPATTSQASSSPRAESNTNTEQKQNEQKQSASVQRDTAQTSQAQRSQSQQSQTQSASSQESSSASAEKRAARNEQSSSLPPSKETPPEARTTPRNRAANDATANDARGARNSDNPQQSNVSQGNATGATPYTSEETVVLRFAAGSSEITPPMRIVLNRLAARLRSQRFAYPALQVEVEGHSSNEGTSEANLRLSVERAAAVARYLRQQTGMREEKVRWTGYGELRPAADDRFGRHTSRRVEVRVRW